MSFLVIGRKQKVIYLCLSRRTRKLEAYAISCLRHLSFFENSTSRPRERNICFYKKRSCFIHLLISFKLESYVIILTLDRKVISYLFSHLIIIIASSFVKDLFYNLLFMKLKAILYCFIFIYFSKILFYSFLNFENTNKKILLII